MTEGTLLTPLSIVMAFIGVIEATLAFRVTALQGRAQMIFVWFMVTFPAAVLAGFFYIQITSPISWYPPSELNKTTTERLKFLDRSSQKLASIELIDAANVSKSRTIGSVPQASSAIELYQAGKYEEAVKLFREELTAQRQIPNPFPTGVTRDSSNGSQHRSYIELPRSIRGSHNCLMNSNSGDQNNAFGDEALFANTTSSFNSAFGDDTLHDCTSGDSNVDMGDEAGNSITDASDNVAIGAGGRSVLRATPQPAPRRRATCQRRLSYSRLSAEGIVVYMLASMGPPTWNTLES